MEWKDHIGNVLDDISITDETSVGAIKMIVNSSDQGSIRRVYGWSDIKESVFLFNAEAFKQ